MIHYDLFIYSILIITVTTKGREITTKIETEKRKKTGTESVTMTTGEGDTARKTGTGRGGTVGGVAVERGTERGREEGAGAGKTSNISSSFHSKCM